MYTLHFIRPIWLVGVVVAPVLTWWVYHRATQTDPWRRVCDAELLASLREDRGFASALAHGYFALLGVITSIALAGPTWNALDTTAFRSQRALVVVLDLSRSMQARDVTPSRLHVAHAHARALFEKEREGLLGLVVFAGDAFTIAPLTPDGHALGAILPAMTPEIVPRQGSRVDLGLAKALELLRGSALTEGSIVVISDGMVGDRALDRARRLAERGVTVSVLAVGTAAGGRIPIVGGGYLRSLNGAEVVARAELDSLRSLARAGSGRFLQANVASTELGGFLPHATLGTENIRGSERETRIWVDRGPWITLLLLPLAAVFFRRGWIVAIACVCLLPTMTVHADADFGGLRTLPGADPQVGGFETSDIETNRDSWRWRGVALYREARYLEAAEAFAQGDTSDDHYNRGNALAKSGLFRPALAAFEQALDKNPQNADARFNRDLVAGLVRELPQDTQTRKGDESASERARGANQSEPNGSRDAADTRRAASTQSSGAAPAERLDALAAQAIEGDGVSVHATRGDAETYDALEGTLDSIAADRMTLWRRKIENRWRRRSQPLPAQSDAW